MVALDLGNRSLKGKTFTERNPSARLWVELPCRVCIDFDMHDAGYLSPGNEVDEPLTGNLFLFFGDWIFDFHIFGNLEKTFIFRAVDLVFEVENFTTVWIFGCLIKES